MTERVIHICSVPIWEKDVYWDTLLYICRSKTCTLDNLKKDLNHYSMEEIKEAIKGLLEYEDIKQIKRGVYEFIEKR